MRKNKICLEKRSQVEIGQHFSVRKNHITVQGRCKNVWQELGMDSRVRFRSPQTPEAHINTKLISENLFLPSVVPCNCTSSVTREISAYQFFPSILFLLLPFHSCRSVLTTATTEKLSIFYHNMEQQ